MTENRQTRFATGLLIAIAVILTGLIWSGIPLAHLVRALGL
jgi:hypothetical protein